MRIDFEVDGDVQVSRNLLRLGDRFTDARPAFEKIHDMLMEMTEEQFSSEGARASGGWQQLKAATLKAKAAKGQDSRILHATGKLEASLTRKGSEGHKAIITDSFIVFGSTLDYMAVHQKGAPSVNVPQRRPLELTRADRRDFVKVLQRYFMTGHA